MGQLITWAVWVYSSPGLALAVFEVIKAELLPIPTSGNSCPVKAGDVVSVFIFIQISIVLRWGS